MFRSSIVASCLFLLAACSQHTNAHIGYGNCNTSGCFGCTDATQANCWPLPYDPCMSAADCAVGSVCASIGCTIVCAGDDDCRQGELCTKGHYCAPGQATTTLVGDGDGGATTLGGGDGGVTHGGGDAGVPGVLSCSDDSQCNAGESCVASQCTHAASCGIPATLCAQPSDCGAGRTCITGYCHIECELSVACPVGQACSAGACIDTTPANAQCVFDHDCLGPSRCINATCHPLCTNSAQCGYGAVCSFGVCRADPRPAAATPN